MQVSSAALGADAETFDVDSGRLPIDNTEERLMPKPYETWTVTPHGPIEKISDNIWRVSAPFPRGIIERTMILVRLGDGRIVIHSAIALGDGEMKEIDSWGAPSFLIVPNKGHRMDARIFKDR
jgi:hypothetical protein